MHDPLCVFYMMTRNSPSWMLAPRAPEDIRVETAGQWTRGMHVIDRRNRKKAGATEQVKSPGAAIVANPMESIEVSKDLTTGAAETEDAPGDHGSWWLDPNKGNRINRIVGTPGELAFGPYFVDRVFGPH